MSKQLKEIPPLEPGQRIELPPKLLTMGRGLMRLAPLQKHDATVVKISDSIVEVGRILDPIKITADGCYHDGRKRMAAAKLRQLETVPCEVITDEEAKYIIITSLECRAHQIEGQRVFELVAEIEDAFAHAWAKRMANLGQKVVETKGFGFGQEDDKPNELETWAKRWGVSVEFLRQAHKIRQYFKDTTKRDMGPDDDGEIVKNVTFEEYYLPRLFRAHKPYGLGAIKAGIESRLKRESLPLDKKKDTAGGRPTKVTKQLELFKDTFKDFKTRYAYWGKFDEAAKEEALTPLDKSLEQMPDDLLETMAKKLADEKKRRKAAKENN